MRRKRTIVVGVGAALLLAAGGAGIAQAVSGDDESVSQPVAERAARAALEAAPGGSVLEVERQDDGGSGDYEVEVRRRDGSTVEIHLDAGFRVVGTEADDDTGDDEDERADD